MSDEFGDRHSGAGTGSFSDDSNDPAEGSEEPGRQRRDIPDFLRRTIYAGLGAIFTSEEGIKRVAQDFSLPKDVASYLVGQAQNTKTEFVRAVSSELGRFLQGLRLNEEISRVLAGLTIEVEAKVRFVPEEGTTKGSASAKGVVRRKIRIRTKATEKPPSADDEVDQNAT